jgi:chromosome segregation ATPase
MNKNLEEDIEFLRQRIYLNEEDISEISDPAYELTDAIDDLRYEVSRYDKTRAKISNLAAREASINYDLYKKSQILKTESIRLNALKTDLKMKGKNIIPEVEEEIEGLLRKYLGMSV